MCHISSASFLFLILVFLYGYSNNCLSDIEFTTLNECLFPLHINGSMSSYLFHKPTYHISFSTIYWWTWNSIINWSYEFMESPPLFWFWSCMIFKDTDFWGTLFECFLLPLLYASILIGNLQMKLSLAQNFSLCTKFFLLICRSLVFDRSMIRRKWI